MRRLAAAAIVTVVFAAACGGGTVSAGGRGCAGDQCYAVYEKLSGPGSHIVDLEWINPDGDESIDAELTFSIEKGAVVISFPDDAGATVSVSVDPESSPQVLRETISGSTVTFAFDPDGTIENAEVIIRRSDG